MNTFPFFVGVDVFKDRLNVASNPADDSWMFGNDGPGIAALVEHLRPLSPAFIVVKSAGGLEIPLMGALAAAHIRCLVVTAEDASDFARTIGWLDKADTAAAPILARLAEAEWLAATFPTARALRDSDDRYSLTVKGANDGLWYWNLRTNKTYYSPRWKFMLGYDEHAIGQSPEEWFSRVHPEDFERMNAQLVEHFSGKTAHYESEYRMRHKDGAYRWVLCRGVAASDAEGKVSRMAGSQTDLSERKRIEEQALYDALHDTLTGLPNRALFLDRLGVSIRRSKRRDSHAFALLFLDLDRFKLVNDSFGHVIGDRLLIETAHRLQMCLRPADTVARMGGDEFTILLDEIQSLSDATNVADRIQKELTTPFLLNEQEVLISASIGIAVSTTEYDGPDDVLRDADTAMYRAKALGRARWVVFDKEMQAGNLALLQADVDLRRAVEQLELQLHYQPIVSVKSGRIIGAEALLRWNHPHRGLIPPSEFIPIAERSGLIVPIGEWVLRTALAQSKAWLDAGLPPLRLGVNLSSRELKQKDLGAIIARALADTTLDPKCLGLELTEGVVMKNLEATLKTLNELDEMGVQLSIDNFGTGFSSLSHLKRLPINTLKIDRSLVRDITTDPDVALIVTAVIALAHTLNLRVIAEGVETEEQLDFLRSKQCDAIQGFLFSRPVPAEMLTKLLQA